MSRYKKSIAIISGGCEFGTKTVDGVPGKYRNRVNRTFKTHKIIDKKEQNSHLEVFHHMYAKITFHNKIDG